jgi:hypothetical protein
LSPRFEVDEGQRVRRLDEPPPYDAPPTIEQLSKEAARNHELERACQAERTTWRAKRRDAEREWAQRGCRGVPGRFRAARDGASVAVATRCVSVTSRGRLQFDAHDAEVPARDVPAEAHRRFRTDLQTARALRQAQVAEGLRVHEERKQAIAAWMATHGSSEQQARHAAGLLPMDEAIEVMTDEARDVELCKNGTRNGAPGRARTCDPELRRLVLYPTELRAPDGPSTAFTIAQHPRMRTHSRDR